MRTSWRLSRKAMNLKYALLGFFRGSKVLILVLCVVAAIGVLTGVFVAIKSGITIANIGDFNICISTSGKTIAFASVWDRFFSVTINFAIISVASLSIFLLPLGFVVVAYRAYLVGFNVALMVCLFGVGGAIWGIIVVVPCQLVLLAVEILFCAAMVQNADCKKKYGRPCCSFPKWLLVCLGGSFLVCLVEAILLFVFSATAILVI
ncbi:MAG: hypothetical protein IKB21_02855 [Clostridia bacterium]|nr:hypothetical protein [Clostridia bacterium]